MAFTANRFLLAYRRMPDGEVEYYDLDEFTGRSAVGSVPQEAVKPVIESIDDKLAIEQGHLFTKPT